MKKTFIALLPLAALATGCSDNQQPDPGPSATGHEIGFYATAPKGTRAASTTTATLQDFLVYAYTDTSVIMDGVTVRRDGGSWTYSPAVYWPGVPVDFYAVSPASGAWGSQSSGESDNKPVARLTCGGTDYLYAVTLDQVESPAPVPLTFRHAMSKVAVMLSSTSNRYTVEVYHVSLNNISLSGDFTMPQHNTSDSGGPGKWDGLSAPGKTLTYYDIDGVAATLTPTPVDLTEGNLNTSYFVPQALQKLAYSPSSGFTGSFMQIDCIVKDKATGEKVWPNEHTPEYLLVEQTDCGRMLFPLSTPAVTSWQQGYSYVYNVVINNTYTVDTIGFAPVVEDYVVTQPF